MKPARPESLPPPKEPLPRYVSQRAICVTAARAPEARLALQPKLPRLHTAGSHGTTAEAGEATASYCNAQRATHARQSLAAA